MTLHRLIPLLLLAACAQDASDGLVLGPGGGDGKSDSSAPVTATLRVGTDSPDSLEVQCNEYFNCDMYLELRMIDSADANGEPLGDSSPLNVSLFEIDSASGYKRPWMNDLLHPATTQDYHLHSDDRNQRYRLELSAAVYLQVDWALVKVTAHWN